MIRTSDKNQGMFLAKKVMLASAEWNEIFEEEATRLELYIQKIIIQK